MTGQVIHIEPGYHVALEPDGRIWKNYLNVPELCIADGFSYLGHWATDPTPEEIAEILQTRKELAPVSQSAEGPPSNRGS